MNRMCQYGSDVSGRKNVPANCRHISGGVKDNQLIGLAEAKHSHECSANNKYD